MFEINNREISLNQPPYIIAELSANHNGSLKKAKESILSAKKCGANAIKLQTYNADSMTIDCNKEDFRIKDGLWDGYTLYDLYKEASTPYDWHKDLFDFAKKNKITIFSSPFDEEAVDLLEKLNTPAYKIASFELVDTPLIKYIAKKNKPILLSTGMATLDEISEAIEVIKKEGCNKIFLFHCISSYPTPTSESNIRMIQILRDKYNLEVGLSDHTLNNTASLAAITLGATAIEKHFILDRSNKSPDSDFSIEPKELKELVESTNDCWQALKVKTFQRPDYESKNKIFRRSLYFIKDLKAGEKITSEHVKRIRPGFGLAPKYYSQILNKKVIKDISRGERVKWELISD